MNNKPLGVGVEKLLMFRQGQKTINAYCADGVDQASLVTFLDIYVRPLSWHRGPIIGIKLAFSKPPASNDLVSLEHFVDRLASYDEGTTFRCVFEYEDASYKDLLQVVEDKVQVLSQTRPLSREKIRELDEHFNALITWSSNALEGNSLTRGETEAIIQGLIQLSEQKTLDDILDAKNLYDAVGLARKMVKSAVVNEEEFKQLHSFLLWNIKAWAGKYRDQLTDPDRRVHIPTTTFKFPEPEEVPTAMAGFFKWLADNWDSMHPIQLATQAHLHTVSIHPFRDGNGRSTRLLMNLILMCKGYPVSIIYPGYKDIYEEALKKAQLGGDQQQLLIQ